MIWANVGETLKKRVKILAIKLNMSLTEYVYGALQYRLAHEAEVKKFVDNVLKMEYIDTENKTDGKQ